MEIKSIDKIVPELYYEYGTYVNTEKMVPSIIDGLLPVHKRILYATYKIARNKWIKTRNVLGEVMGKYHPHNVDTGPFAWAVYNGFIDGKGSWGSNVGKTPHGPAADRYTNVKLNDVTLNDAFKYIEYTEWCKNDLDYDEPAFIPTIIPFCLMSKHELVTIAFGFKSQIPCYKKSDLIKRLFYLLGKRKKITISPIINGCDVLSSNNELEDLLLTGSGSLKIRGIYEVDEKNYIVRIHGWSPRTTYQALEKQINNYKKWNLIENGDIGSNDDSTKTTNIRFEVIRRNGKVEIFNKMVEAIENALTTTINYDVYVVENKNSIKCSIDKMLLTTYLNFQKVFKKYLESFDIKITDAINEMKIIQKIKPHLSNSFTKNKLDDTYNYLSSQTKISIDIIKNICQKYYISKLMTVDTDTTKLDSMLKDVRNQLNNIEEETLKHYK